MVYIVMSPRDGVPRASEPDSTNLPCYMCYMSITSHIARVKIQLTNKISVLLATLTVSVT